MSGKRKGDHLPTGSQLPKRQETEESKGSPNDPRAEEASNNEQLDESKAPTPTRTYDQPMANEKSTIPSIEAHHSVLPLSMQLMKFWNTNCINCAPVRSANGTTRFSSLHGTGPRYHAESTPSFIGRDGEVVGEGQMYCSPVWNEEKVSTANQATDADKNEEVAQVGDSAREHDSTIVQTNNDTGLRNRRSSKLEVVDDRRTHLESIPPSPRSHTLPVMQEYLTAIQMYGCKDVNPGVLTALRFSLPTLRVSGNFHDADMLALAEVLFRHCNGALKHIQRLDFSIAGRFGKLHGRKGFGSHGAFTLSRVLCISNYIEDVFIQRNRIGPYGAAAIFAAASKNPVVKTIEMRRCGIGEKGAMAFVEHIGKSNVCGLKEVDLSVNRIGFRGSIMIEEMLIEKEDKGKVIDVDLEGNLVLQEIMNGLTHGLGVILCVIGTFLMHQRVKDAGANTRISCGAYSVSLLVLYVSSTLYHSFFALKYTRYIFECLDHCAIYILITGSYTPFLRIALHDKPLGSFYLLIFLYVCCISGVMVEAFYNTWIHKPKFSLAMYLGMGWSCVICMPDMMEVLPQEAINLVVLGGIGYTSGVPFFVRNNNLDHSIWHCFVLAGSAVHWFCIYLYVAPMELN